MYAGDMFHLPFVGDRFQRFSPLDATGVETKIGHLWNKPPGANFIYMLLIGAGGGGGAGRTGATSTGRGGGGGGGSGAVTSYIYPSLFLPETLIIRPGRGGTAGGIGGGASGQGGTSLVCVRPINLGDMPDPACIAFARGGAGGNVGGTSGTAAAGAGGVIQGSGVVSEPGLQWHGVKNAVAGILGGTGGSPTGPTAGAGSAGNLFEDVFLSGGTGGGACSTSNAESAGGVLDTTPYPSISTFLSLPPGGAAGGGAGTPGAVCWRPLMTFGGTGGGGDADGTGGAGGRGGIGSGGGGGGGGITGGLGGFGGDGLIVIGWW